MKPNHFLTRLRQDIRKMRGATSVEGYLRFRRFAVSKVQTLAIRYKAGQMTEVDKIAFNQCLNSFMVASQEHPEFEAVAKKTK